MGYTLEKLIEMIPLYVNRRLSEGEKHDFEIALGKYPELNRELMEFTEIRKCYNEIKEDAPSSSNDLYDKIINNIREKEKATAQIFVKPRFRDQVLWFLKRSFATPQLSWSVVAVQLVVIIAFLIAFPKYYSFRTLSEIPVAQEDNRMLNVVFKEDAKEKDMRKLIEQINGSIISGPTPDGLYIIKLNNYNIDSALNELKNSTFVRLAVRRY